MAAQKVKSDRGMPGRQDRRPQRRRSYRRTGTFALVTTVVVVVAAAAFAVWSSERTHDETQLGRPSATGPAVDGRTEPSATGPAVTDPTEPLNEAAERPNRFRPQGVERATPEDGRHGKLVMSDSGIHPWYAVRVYADGRVIWRRELSSGGDSGWLERRLTPEGLKLLRSGAVRLGGQLDNPASELPASAWEDPGPEAYAAWRYAVCHRGPAAAAWRLLPRRARDLLRGTEQGYIHGCLVVTTEDARALDEVLLKVDWFERSEGPGLVWFENEDPPDADIWFEPVLPNATFKGCCLGRSGVATRSRDEGRGEMYGHR